VASPAWLGGLLLVLGALAFAVGAGNPHLVRVWTSSDEVGLPIIHVHPRSWRVTAILMIAATVLTAAGLWLLADVLATPLARAGAVGYLLAAGCWIAHLAARLSVTPAAAAGFVAGDGIDPAYRLFGRWTGSLFAVFTVVAGLSLVAIGAAVLGSALAFGAGWTGIGFGVLIVGGFLAFGDMPPFVSYIPTLLFGIALLQRSG